MNKALRKEFESSTKLSQLLEIAIREVEQIIKTKKAYLNMDDWVCRGFEKRCSVCMAGAILFNMLDNENINADNIENEFKYYPYIRRLCFVVDDLRIGAVGEYSELYKFVEKNYSEKIIEQIVIYIQSMDISLEIKEWFDIEKSLTFYKKFAKDLKEIEKGETA